jgi:cytoskeletal protein RodZ
LSDRSGSLGQFLRQERERKGVTLEQVASATKVSVRQLHALEADQYAEMPAKPFIRGFVTSYARFIGLDAKEILTQYDSFIDTKVLERPSRDSGHSGYAFEKKEGDQSQTLLWILIGTLALVTAIAFIIFKPKLGRHHSRQADRLRAVHTPTPSPLPSSAPSPHPTSVSALAVAPSPVPSAKATLIPVAKPTPVPSVKATPIPAPEPSPASSPKEKPDPLNSGVGLTPTQIKHKALFKAVDDIWVRYRVDDRPVMRFILRKDRILVLRAEREIRFQASSTPNVLLNLNGQGFRPLTSVKFLAVERGQPTFRVTTEPLETSSEMFPGERQLPKEVPPPSRDAS